MAASVNATAAATVASAADTAVPTASTLLTDPLDVNYPFFLSTAPAAGGK
jgi:hypothetical protein